MPVRNSFGLFVFWRFPIHTSAGTATILKLMVFFSSSRRITGQQRKLVYKRVFHILYNSIFTVVQ